MTVHAITVIRIDCDATWRAVPADPGRPPGRSGGTEPVPVTPRAVLWVSPPGAQARPNALASALLTFLQLPIRQLHGPAYLTGRGAATPAGAVALTPTQLRAFASTLHALQAMPDYLALHAQACRIAAAWLCPTGSVQPRDGSFS